MDSVDGTGESLHRKSLVEEEDDESEGAGGGQKYWACGWPGSSPETVKHLDGLLRSQKRM